MANKDFDDLLKVLRVSVTLNGTTTVSTEIDFELPRGFIAKIRKVHIGIWNITDVLIAAEVVSVNGALVRDPDDATQVQFPQNTVEHDVIADYQQEYIGIVGAAGQFTVKNHGNQGIFDFEAMGVDVITARNMRINTQADGTELGTATTRVIIFYTLEKVTDVDILNLLDIL